MSPQHETWEPCGFRPPTSEAPDRARSKNQTPKAKIGCSVATILFAAALSLGQGNPPIGLVFDNAHVDLGRVEAAGNIEQDFPFRVAGDAPVEILDVRPSCGCLHPSLAKRVYSPGERDVLRFAVHAASQQNGKRRYQVTLNVRQGTRLETVPVILDLDLKKPIEIQPSNLMLYVQGRQPIQQTLRITAPPTIRIDQIQTSSNRLAADDIVASREDPNLRQLTLTISGEFPPGRTEEWVSVRTAGAREETLVVPVTVVRPSRVRIIPEKLTTNRTVLGDRPARWQVLLADSKGEPLRIEAASCGDPRVHVDWPRDRTTRCRLIVELKPVPSETPFEAEVMLKIAEPVAATLSLPVRVD